MPSATYTGYEPLTYLHYTDLSTGQTLYCEPGGVYDIGPDVPQDGRFITTSEEESRETPEEGVEDPEETGE